MKQSSVLIKGTEPKNLELEPWLWVVQANTAKECLVDDSVIPCEQQVLKKSPEHSEPCGSVYTG